MSLCIDAVFCGDFMAFMIITSMPNSALRIIANTHEIECGELLSMGQTIRLHVCCPASAMMGTDSIDSNNQRE